MTEINNVWAKLIKARQMFLSGGIEKSGKNPQLEFKYFELKDIVPTVTDIFVELGLLAVCNFTNEEAILSVVNCEKPDEVVVFTSPMRFVEPNRGTNPLMAMGASHTYMRRYMYMLAMDICEPDAIDGGLIGDNDDAPATSKKSTTGKRKSPATPKEREQIKDELTATNDPATEMQINALKEACNTLLDKDPDQEEFVQQLAVESEGFTNLTKDQCETLIKGISEILSKYEG